MGARTPVRLRPWSAGAGGPHRRGLFWRVLVPLVAAAAGLMFAVSAGTSRGTDLRAERLTELTELIAAQEQRNTETDRELAALRAEVGRLSAAQGGDQQVRAAQERAERLAAPAGITPVTGPAVTVVLDDAPRDVRPAPGFDPPSADDLVVHQQDVQAVVNALWAGGAEAMQIMDQRTISTSAVRCVGNTLILQGRVYSPPFVITAVGDVAGMTGALDRSPSVAVYRQYVAAYGLGYRVETRSAVTLPAFTGSIELQHAQVPPGESETETTP